MGNQVNLETDVLDSPELFWEYSDYDFLYDSCRQHLDVDHRVSIMNQRFEVLGDLFDFLEEEITEQKSTWLEWVVIFVVAFDVVVMAFRLYVRWNAKKKGVHLM